MPKKKVIVEDVTPVEASAEVKEPETKVLVAETKGHNIFKIGKTFELWTKFGQKLESGDFKTLNKKMMELRKFI